MFFRLLFSIALVFLVLQFGCAREGNPYVRIKDSAFQVALKSFEAPNKKGPKIKLLGVIHIGDQGYYEKLQQRLDNAAMVLYEGAGTPAEYKQLRNQCPKVLEEKVMVDHDSSAAELELVSQSKHIRKGSNFVHADIGLAEFFDELNIAKGKALCERYAEAATHEDTRVSASPFQWLSADRSRNILAFSLAKSLGHEKSTTKKDEIVIFHRNRIVMNTLREKLPLLGPHQEVIIFYGAAHMPDIELSLNSLDYYQNGAEWFDAFSL